MSHLFVATQVGTFDRVLSGKEYSLRPNFWSRELEQKQLSRQETRRVLYKVGRLLFSLLLADGGQVGALVLLALRHFDGRLPGNVTD